MNLAGNMKSALFCVATQPSFWLNKVPARAACVTMSLQATFLQLNMESYSGAHHKEVPVGLVIVWVARELRESE